MVPINYYLGLLTAFVRIFFIFSALCFIADHKTVKFEVSEVGYWLLVLFDLTITSSEICPAKMADSETDFIPNAFSLFLGAKELYIHLLKINIIFITTVRY